MLLASKPPALRSTNVRAFEQVPSLDKYSACVRLSTQALSDGELFVAAVAMPPTSVAPSKNPTPTFAIVLFMQEPPNFLELLLSL
ncbi:unannotated protein [freshwater metagenome]|uniref:Unannotated protein n=1 Tax=freshwater metagenome TaxID=449393 RepID=A0A6J7N8X0_9ZZZZ